MVLEARVNACDSVDFTDAVFADDVLREFGLEPHRLPG
jgi:hypothetical protein